MERDDDGLDISDVDPELAEFLEPGGEIDYPTIQDPAHLAGLAPHPEEGGVEDDDLNRVLGDPEALYRRLREDPDAGLQESTD